MQSLEELNTLYVPLLQNISAGEESFVSIKGAKVLCKFGYLEEGIPVLVNGTGSENPYNALMAARAFVLLPYEQVLIIDNNIVNKNFKKGIDELD